MSFVISAVHTSNLPVEEEGPPQLDQEPRSSPPSVSFPLVKLQSLLLEKSKQRNENMSNSQIR